jgi:hypothetical protein
MNLIVILILSIIIGTSYYYMMEKSLPIDSNCTFISTIWTDLFAFIWGFIIIYKGYQYNDNLLILLAGILIVEHIWQVLPKYQINKIINVN